MAIDKYIKTGDVKTVSLAFEKFLDEGFSNLLKTHEDT